jgi:DNA/RNA endonuclease YhcR with UshA esterase domain
MVVRIFSYGSLVLAIGGLIVLLLVANRTEVPAVETGNVVGTMNWAYVHVEGVASRQPTYDATAKTLKFWVLDGTGEILVTAYRSEAEEMLAADRVPMMGDEVALEGTLRIAEDFHYLVLNEPQNMEILPAKPVEAAIAQIDAGRLYQKVTLRGVIRDERVPYEGLRILCLCDATGEIDVTLSSDTLGLSDEPPVLSVGQSVQVTGVVDQYRGTPQISVGRGSDLVVLDEPIAIAPLQRIGELSAQDVGGLVMVEGTLSAVDLFSAGAKFSLDDSSGKVTLLLWQALYESLPQHDTLKAGTTVRVLGEVAEYQGDLEIVPQIPSDVRVLATGERIVADRQLGELGADDLGRLVGVEAVLRSLRTFSAGLKGVLDDGTGVMTLLLWQDVYDELPEASAVVPGAVLHVEGEVTEYGGELELVPQVPADIEVVGMVDLPLEDRAIGQITADDVGHTVQLGGRVSEASAFSTGMKYTVDDGTGTITLLLWQNLYDQLADASLLAVGAQVSARGEIAEYQGELEIVPQLPVDVAVTGTGEEASSVSTPTIEGTAVARDNPEPASEPTVASVAEKLEPTLAPTPSPTPSPAPTPSPEVRTIGGLSSGDMGRIFTIAQSGIAEVDYFSSGVKYGLSDGTGNIILLLWQNVLEEIPGRYDLVPGTQVQVIGEIDEYGGDLEIVPRKGSEVVILARGERLPIEVRQVRDVTPSDEGRVFTVEGVVARTERDEWLRMWLNDGTGEILIFVPERAVAYLPPGIGDGVQLRVTGEVDIYRGILEIIPLAGADVELR